MLNSGTIKMIAGVILLGASTSPALADSDWDRHHLHHWEKRELREAARYNSWPSEWNGQRVYIANNWERRNAAMAAAERESLELQMRNSWNEYHHNEYRGPYTWNVYNDPAYFDYIHTSNPGLFTQVRTYLGI